MQAYDPKYMVGILPGLARPLWELSNIHIPFEPGLNRQVGFRKLAHPQKIWKAGHWRLWSPADCFRKYTLKCSPNQKFVTAPRHRRNGQEKTQDANVPERVRLVGWRVSGAPPVSRVPFHRKVASKAEVCLLPDRVRGRLDLVKFIPAFSEANALFKFGIEPRRKDRHITIRQIAHPLFPDPWQGR